MARIRMPDLPMLESWSEVDAALMEIAQAEIALTRINCDKDEQINILTEAAARVATPINGRITELREQIKQFAELNRLDFGKAKSKRLNFGELGWRLSSTIDIKPSAVPKVIENLRRMGMDDCVKVRESVNKDTLKTYSEERILQSGASIKTTDTFWLETDKERIINAN